MDEPQERNVSQIPMFEELKSMSDEDLRREHDRTTTYEMVNGEFFLNELSRRQLGRLTRWLIWLTVAIAVLTAANVVLVAVSITR